MADEQRLLLDQEWFYGCSWSMGPPRRSCAVASRSSTSRRVVSGGGADHCLTAVKAAVGEQVQPARRRNMIGHKGFRLLGYSSQISDVAPRQAHGAETLGVLHPR